MIYPSNYCIVISYFNKSLFFLIPGPGCVSLSSLRGFLLYECTEEILANCIAKHAHGREINYSPGCYLRKCGICSKSVSFHLLFLRVCSGLYVLLAAVYSKRTAEAINTTLTYFIWICYLKRSKSSFNIYYICQCLDPFNYCISPNEHSLISTFLCPSTHLTNFLERWRS